jgi:hypothetical protein
VDNSPPEIVSTPGNSGTGAAYLYRVEARDPDGDRRLRFRLEEAPEGMVIDPITGSLSWTPPADAVGRHPVEVVVDDLQGGTDSQRFTVDITEEAASGETDAASAAAEADAPPAAADAPPAAADEDGR